MTAQLGWLADLVAESGQTFLDAHWDRISIETVSVEFKPDGARVNSHAYKAVSDAWGWGTLPPGVSGSSRVKWMGLELAGRQLRSAAYRMEVVYLLLAGADPAQCPDLVTGRNTHRQIGRHLDRTGTLPVDLFDLEPDAPRLPAQVVLAAADCQFAQLVIAPDQTSVTIKVLLPTTARPGKKDWESVALSASLPQRYRAGKLLAPTLRVVDGQVRLDVPVQADPVTLADTGRTLGLDWGVNRTLTGAVASRIPFPTSSSLAQLDLRTLIPAVDGHPLFFDASGLLKKARLLGEEREKLQKKLTHWDRLLTGKPDPDLEAKRQVLLREVEAVTARQRHLLDAVARLAARWAVTQALHAGCSTIALEDLKTLEHRDRGKKLNVKTSLALRGQVHHAIEEAATLVGLRVVTVPAGGTSMFCPRCDGKVQHKTAPTGVSGHPWTYCPSCHHSADRDHAAAEKVAQRGLAPRVRKVRHQRTKRAALVLTRPQGSATTPKKGAPTPSQPSTRSRGKGRCAGRIVTPPPALLVHRWVGPVPQGNSSIIAAPQVRTKVPVSTDLGGLLQAHRQRLKATPVRYRRGTWP